MRILSKRLLASALLLLGILCSCTARNELFIVFPKIGSADAALLMSQNATVLIDTGESNDGDEILELLEQYGRDSIDLMILSHYDKDHIGGAPEILNTITVRRVVGSLVPKDSDEYSDYQNALRAAGLSEEIPERSETIRLELDGMIIEVDAPDEIYDADTSNNASTITTVTYGDTVMLFAGDAMTQRLSEEQWEQDAYDLIKIPHHGRDLEDVPDYIFSVKDGSGAIITSSKKEPENDHMTELLSQAGLIPYLTREGSVIAFSDGASIRIIQNN